MKKFSVSQENNLFTGTDLAAELSASSPERRAFVVIGAYIQLPKGLKTLQKHLMQIGQMCDSG